MLFASLKNRLNLIPHAFGLDISDTSIKFFQLSKYRTRFEIEAYGQKNIESGLVSRGSIKDVKKLSQILATMLKEYKDGGLSNYVVFSVPDEQVFLKSVTMPQISAEELGSSILVEAERSMPIDIESAYLDYHIIKSDEGNGNMEVLLAASPKKEVDAFIEVVECAGLTPIIAEPEIAAIARSVILTQDAKTAAVIVEIGANRTRLIGFDNNSVISTGSVNFSADLINQLMAEKLKIDIKEAKKIKWDKNLFEDSKYGSTAKLVLEKPLDVVIKEIKNNIDAWQTELQNNDGGFSPKKVIISGGGANIPTLVEKLQTALKIPVEKAKPLISIFGKETEKRTKKKKKKKKNIKKKQKNNKKK